MKGRHIFFILLLLMLNMDASADIRFFPASDKRIQYMGRVDFTDPLGPTMWASATQVLFSFRGDSGKVIITDEVLYGTNHNYIDLVVDGKYTRFQLSKHTDTISIAGDLKKSVHDVVVSKSSEAGIGYIRFEGVFCEALVPAPARPSRKIEFFGDSITSAMGSDSSLVGCHKGEWYDQTNAYMSYGALTARSLDAQYQLTSVSGIGLIHSCCDMKILMPQVYDKVSLTENRINWDFSRYQPDVIAICLGQNDGLQDSASFCTAYISFLKALRRAYPAATVLCLSSPMADAALLAQTKKYLPAVIASWGDKNVYPFFFSKQSVSGCDSHPSLPEHRQIAGELTGFIKKIKKW